MKVQRHERILDQLRAEVHLEVKDLSERLGVSAATVRRDLSMLSTQNLVRRSYGGASLVEKDIDQGADHSDTAREASFEEPPLHTRQRTARSEKRIIGKAAAALINDGDVVYVSGGSTAFEAARHLCDKRRLTVITPAINIVSYLAHYPHISVIVPGGMLVHRHLTLVGHIARDALGNLCADKAIMGVSAISVSAGITAETLQDAETDRMVMEFARCLIVVADASKFSLVGAARVAPVDTVQHLVTDGGAPTDELAKLRKRGVDVRVAGEPLSEEA